MHGSRHRQPPPALCCVRGPPAGTWPPVGRLQQKGRDDLVGGSGPSPGTIRARSRGVGEQAIFKAYLSDGSAKQAPRSPHLSSWPAVGCRHRGCSARAFCPKGPGACHGLGSSMSAATCHAAGDTPSGPSSSSYSLVPGSALGERADGGGVADPEQGELQPVASAGVGLAGEPVCAEILRGDARPAHGLLDVAAADGLETAGGAPVDQQVRVGRGRPAGTAGPSPVPRCTPPPRPPPRCRRSTPRGAHRTPLPLHPPPPPHPRSPPHPPLPHPPP